VHASGAANLPIEALKNAYPSVSSVTHFERAPAVKDECAVAQVWSAIIEY
jgi:hypothetical protein